MKQREGQRNNTLFQFRRQRRKRFTVAKEAKRRSREASTPQGMKIREDKRFKQPRSAKYEPESRYDDADMG